MHGCYKEWTLRTDFKYKHKQSKNKTCMFYLEMIINIIGISAGQVRFTIHCQGCPSACTRSLSRSFPHSHAAVYCSLLLMTNSSLLMVSCLWLTLSCLLSTQLWSTFFYIWSTHPCLLSTHYFDGQHFLSFTVNPIFAYAAKTSLLMLNALWSLPNAELFVA